MIGMMVVGPRYLAGLGVLVSLAAHGCVPEEISRSRRHRGRHPVGDLAADQVTGDPKSGDLAAGDTKIGDASLGDANAGDIETGDTIAGDASLGDTKFGDANLGDTIAGDTNLGDAIAGDAIAGDANLGDALAGDACTAPCGVCLPCAPSNVIATPGVGAVTLSWPDRSAAGVGPLPESSHPYANDSDLTRRYSLFESSSLWVTFDPLTEMQGADFIHISTGGGAAAIGSPFSGTELAGVTVEVLDQTVEIRLTSDSAGAAWGYRVVEIVDAYGAGPVVGYRVYWSTSVGVTKASAAIEVGGPPWLHTPLTAGVPVYYRVAAYDGRGEGSLSAEVSTVPLDAGYRVGGVVTGLFGAGLQLGLNSAETLAVSADGSFEFLTPVQDGASFAVAVTNPPTDPTQVCRIAGGSGSIAGADVTEAEVFCSLQLATFNLEWFDAGDPSTKTQGIANIIEQNGFDIVAVQEVSGPAAMEELIAYLEVAAWDYRLGYSGGDLRLGFLFRPRLFSVSNAGELDHISSGGYIDERGYPWDGFMRLPFRAAISVAGSASSFDLVILHSKAGANSTSCTKRLAQTEDIAAWIGNAAPSSLIVLGDFNDVIAGTGICSGTDALAPFEGDTQLAFATEQPGNMGAGHYTNIPYSSTVDHVMLTTNLWPLLFAVDSLGHVASVVAHGDLGISDHQPAFIWIATE